MSKTYLHAHLKSNPEGSIDLWVSEMERPFFVKGLTESANFEKMMKEWQSSLVCFPTLPEQRKPIRKIAHARKLGVNRVLKIALAEGIDVDPGLFEFDKICTKCNLKYNEPLIVNVCQSCGDLMEEYAVLKSTPAQEEKPATYPKDFVIWYSGMVPEKIENTFNRWMKEARKVEGLEPPAQEEDLWDEAYKLYDRYKDSSYTDPLKELRKNYKLIKR